jgi:hypothetical protein
MMRKKGINVADANLETAGDHFRVYISELVTRLDLAVEHKLRGISKASQCFNCKEAAEYGISLYSLTARHCGKKYCQVRSLVHVISHANEYDVSRAVSSHSESRLHLLVDDVEKLLAKIDHIDDIDDPATEFRCIGYHKEGNCERVARHKISLGNFTIPYCSTNHCCRRFALLTLVTKVLESREGKDAA